LLGRLELLHCASHPCAVDLDPFAAQQHEVLGAGEQSRDLCLGQRLAFSITSMRKLLVSPMADGALLPMLRSLVVGRRLARQVAGMRTTTPAELGDAVQQARRVAGFPTVG
jgi:hypothetical protein